MEKKVSNHPCFALLVNIFFLLHPLRKLSHRLLNCKRPDLPCSTKRTKLGSKCYVAILVMNFPICNTMYSSVAARQFQAKTNCPNLPSMYVRLCCT